MLTLLALASFAAPLLQDTIGVADQVDPPSRGEFDGVDLGENVYATPALAPGRVFLRTTAALYCFGTRP